MDKKGRDNILNFFEIFFIVIAIIYALVTYFKNYNLNNNSETFTNITPGIFPESVSKGILNNFYKWNNPTQVSSFNYERQYPAYPIFPAKSKINNNLEFWPKPINGTCAFPELCGNMYDTLNCQKQEERLARWKVDGKPVTIWPPCKKPRVNFWCSK